MSWSGRAISEPKTVMSKTLAVFGSLETALALTASAALRRSRDGSITSQRLTAAAGKAILFSAANFNRPLLLQ